ncbi:MAG: bifunctional precorrin-2 dehydrogenase/sirohydrochlorin ferrochelatase, partial [Acidobacteria bacterium]|nr:bifunctional precorrin-2 dehydrogenase/sirohydrochlorin ferrochelatase [Acidobacteriota bacterium]
RVLVVGAGKVAAAKIKLLLAEGAHVTVIAREVLEPLPEEVSVIVRPYRYGDLGDFRIAIVAVGDAAINAAIRREADAAGVLLNVVDTPELCDFFFTAVHRDGEVVISVSTQGAAPALAQLIRDVIAQALPPGLGSLASSLRQRREEVHQRGESTESGSWKDLVRSELQALVSSRATSPREV